MKEILSFVFFIIYKLIYFSTAYSLAKRYILPRAFDNYHDKVNFLTISKRFSFLIKRLFRWGAYLAALEIIRRYSKPTNKFETLYVIYVILSEKVTLSNVIYFIDCSYSEQDQDPKERYWIKICLGSTKPSIKCWKDERAYAARYKVEQGD